MRPWIAAAYALVVAPVGCTSHDARPASPAAAPADPNPRTQENPMDNGARSPAGDLHPGEIVHDDKVDGKTWTRSAAEVPPTIAWVMVDDVWKPVVRIEITGTPGHRRFTKFGADGEMLETTIQGTPRPAPSRWPTPTPDKD
jgi:hypothetical protein